MGSKDGAEICELVVFFVLHQLNMLKTGKEGSIGLYQNDGLAAVYNLSGLAINRLKKESPRFFKPMEYA